MKRWMLGFIVGLACCMVGVGIGYAALPARVTEVPTYIISTRTVTTTVSAGAPIYSAKPSAEAQLLAELQEQNRILQQMKDQQFYDSLRR